jgi:hypothetical protein
MRPSRTIPLPLLVLLASVRHHAPPDTADPPPPTSSWPPLRPTDRCTWSSSGGAGRGRPFHGQGVARIQPPHHARLDLFGPRGDTYLSAALVGDDLRLPPGVQAGQIPPPALMWAVLGVVAPPQGPCWWAPATTARGPSCIETWTVAPSGTCWRGALRSARWDGAGRRMVTVELRGRRGRACPPRRPVRDFAAVAELMLNLESVDEVEPFSPDIWNPGR